MFLRAARGRRIASGRIRAQGRRGIDPDCGGRPLAGRSRPRGSARPHSQSSSGLAPTGAAPYLASPQRRSRAMSLLPFVGCRLLDPRRTTPARLLHSTLYLSPRRTVMQSIVRDVPSLKRFAWALVAITILAGSASAQSRDDGRTYAVSTTRLKQLSALTASDV